MQIRQREEQYAASGADVERVYQSHCPLALMSNECSLVICVVRAVDFSLELKPDLT